MDSLAKLILAAVAKDGPIKARDIADKLNGQLSQPISKKEVNSRLYGELRQLVRQNMFNHEWRLANNNALLPAVPKAEDRPRKQKGRRRRNQKLPTPRKPKQSPRGPKRKKVGKQEVEKQHAEGSRRAGQPAGPSSTGSVPLASTETFVGSSKRADPPDASEEVNEDPSDKGIGPVASTRTFVTKEGPSKAAVDHSLKEDAQPPPSNELVPSTQGFSGTQAFETGFQTLDQALEAFTKRFNALAAEGLGAHTHGFQTLEGPSSEALLPPSEPVSIEQGTIIGGRYQVERPIGRGGMGQVFLVLDLELGGTRQALKVSRLDRKSRSLDTALRREIDLLRRLDRPDYFPRVHDSFLMGDQLALVMTWVPGVTLKQLVDQRGLERLGREELLRIVRQIVNRLEYLHEYAGGQIVHRDLKPSNVLVKPASLNLRLIDFGISGVFDPTAKQVAGGTEGYLDPAVLETRDHPPTADKYALGQVIRFLLFNARPDRVARRRSIPLEEARKLHRGWVDLSRQLTRKRPEARPSWTEVRQSLELLARDVDTRHQGRRCSRCDQPVYGHQICCPACGDALTTLQQPPAFKRRVQALQEAGFRQAPFPNAAALEEQFDRLVADSNGPTSFRLFQSFRHGLQLASEDGFAELRSLDRISITPHDYQERAALRVLREFRGRALLADEVGLGKTIEAGLIGREYDVRGLAKRMLIICPPALRQQWKEEMARFRLRFEVIERGDDLPRLTQAPHRYILSQGLLNNRNASRFRLEFDLIIVDEAHNFRRLTNVRSKVFQQLSSRYLLMLTATPVQTSPTDLYNLLSLLRPGFIGTNANDFKATFLSARDSLRIARGEELRRQLRQVMIRNRRRECLVKFPEREPHSLHVELNPSERHAYEQLVQQCRRLGQGGGLVATIMLKLFCSSFRALQTSNVIERVHLPGLRALAGQRHFKMRALMDRILPHLGNRKTLIFAEFIESQRDIYKVLRESGYRCALIREYKGMDRTRLLCRFRDTEEIQLLVCNRSASEGMNLQFCTAMVNYDIPWNPMRLEQRIGRIQRLNSPVSRVQVFNLFAKGTVEDVIYEVLEKRLDMFAEAVGLIEQVLGRLREGQSFEKFVGDALFQQDFDRYVRELGDHFEDLKRKSQQEEQSACEYLDGFDLGATDDDDDLFELGL